MVLKILNLYAGIGGNRKLWSGNIEVTAVEINPEVAEVYKRFYPNDKVIVADAHKYLLEHFKEYDFIWSSPPCQTSSKMNLGTRHKTIRYVDMSLYQEIILLQHFYKGIYVIENVNPYYDALMPFQRSDRHCFWSNFNITNIKVQRPNFLNPDKSFGSGWLHASKKQVEDWLDIHLDKNIYLGKNHCEVQVLRNCVHPKLGLHVFNCAFKDKQSTLLSIPPLVR